MVVWQNLKYCSHALWGFGLKLDPEVNFNETFATHFLHDPVFDYRLGIVVFIFAAIVARHLPGFGVVVLIGWYFVRSVDRSNYFLSDFHFWRQAYKESPRKDRVRRYYNRCLMAEMERQIKAGKSWAELEPMISEARRLTDEIVGSAGFRGVGIPAAPLPAGRGKSDSIDPPPKETKSAPAE